MGYDAGKQVKAAKIHALVDSKGLPMPAVVHSAAIQDRDGAGLVLDSIRRRFPRLELIWADRQLTPRTTGVRPESRRSRMRARRLILRPRCCIHRPAAVSLCASFRAVVAA